MKLDVDNEVRAGDDANFPGKAQLVALLMVYQHDLPFDHFRNKVVQTTKAMSVCAALLKRPI